MVNILMIFILIVAVLLMLVVLVQSSKGGGLAGTFGGGDASMVFGVRRTADFLIKITTALAVIYMTFSLVTNVIINKSGGTQESIIQQQNGPQNFPEQQVPNVPQEQQMPQDQQQQNQQPQDQNQQPPK